MSKRPLSGSASALASTRYGRAAGSACASAQMTVIDAPAVLAGFPQRAHEEPFRAADVEEPVRVAKGGGQELRRLGEDAGERRPAVAVVPVALHPALEVALVVPAAWNRRRRPQARRPRASFSTSAIVAHRCGEAAASTGAVPDAPTASGAYVRLMCTARRPRPCAAPPRDARRRAAALRRRSADPASPTAWSGGNRGTAWRTGARS